MLEIEDVQERLELLGRVLANEREILKLERKIEGQVRSQVHKNQKEFYLNEQLKAIRKELGFARTSSPARSRSCERQIKKAHMPKEVRERAEKELDRLGKMSFMSPEATVVRNYVDWLVSLPWKKRPRTTSTSQPRSRSARRGPLRPRQGQGAHPRVPGGAQAVRADRRAPSSASSARPASGRPRWASRSPAPWAASSSACRSAACATRRRSAATGAPTSARCRAASSRP